MPRRDATPLRAKGLHQFVWGRRKWLFKALVGRSISNPKFCSAKDRAESARHCRQAELGQLLGEREHEGRNPVRSTRERGSEYGKNVLSIPRGRGSVCAGEVSNCACLSQLKEPTLTEKIKLDAAELEGDYHQYFDLASRMRDKAMEQIGSIIENNDLTLGVPLEGRVKTWQSIRDKLERVNLSLRRVADLQDLVGLRAIFLFKDELDDFQSLLSEAFEVISSEDTAERLLDAQFGYQSRHVILKFPDSWLSVPSFQGLDNFVVELQIRTMAQHIWAAASHKLQYKREQSVPLPVRRSIFRVSALLETVDLEFSRVLESRQAYVERRNSIPDEDRSLNVDALRQVLDSTLPEINKDSDEPYDKLLLNLEDLGLSDASALRELIEKHLEAALRSDQDEVRQRGANPEKLFTKEDRQTKGVFWTHVGLVRQILKEEFGDAAVTQTIMKHMDNPI